MKADHLIYLATPYSRYPKGIAMAYVDAAQIAAAMLKKGLRVYSPIVHTHPLAVYGNIDAYDHAIWMPFDQIMMDKADALYIATMEGWMQSKGIAMEIEVFEKAGKPIRTIDPCLLAVHDYLR